MTFSILKNTNFRNYFFADIISGFGTGMSFIGANWFVLEKTGSSSSVGILLSITILAGLIIFPFSGTIADRFNRRKVLFWSNIVRAVFIALVATACYMHTVKVEYLYLLAIVAGMGWSVYLSSSRALVQEIVEHDDLLKANSLVEVSMQVGMFSAAAVAGFLYKYFGLGVILIIDAATFFVSNIFLVNIRYQSIAVTDKHNGFKEQFSNGLKYLIANPLVFAFGVVVALPFVATMSLNVIMPSYVSDFLKADSVVFGFADMSYGIGACLSGFVAALLVERWTQMRALIMFFIFSLGALLFLFTNLYILGLYVGCLIFGLANSSLRIIMNAKIMEVVPKSYMGRAMSVWVAITMFMQIISAYGVGLFIDSVSVIYGFLWLATIMLIGLVLAVCFMLRLRTYQPSTI